VTPDGSQSWKNEGQKPDSIDVQRDESGKSIASFIVS
jgi:hypothetical protein